MKILNSLAVAAALAIISTGGSFESAAAVKLSPIFSSNMVMQQNADVELRGYAAPGSTVKVKPSWNPKARLSATASADGSWKLILATPPAGGPYTIAVSDTDGEVRLDDVLIGDVWVCGGQSNMEMPLRGFAGQPAKGTADMIARADGDRALRLFRQPRAYKTTPNTDVTGGTWTRVNPQEAGDFSAVGYIFGNYIQDVIDLPVGLIQCCWSDSRIQAWMPRDVLEEQFPDMELPALDQTEFGWLTGTPTLLYNGMVAPWEGFPVKGVIWYQGEANSADPAQYKELFPAMKKEWGRLFRNDSLPIYYVQLAPYSGGESKSTRWARFRQAQAELLDEVGNVAMATTGDLGDSIFIHPPRKIEVGERLARLALEDTYGRPGADAKAPIARTAAYNPKDSTIVVTFDNAQSGMTPTRTSLEGFEVVDPYGGIHQATANAWGNNKIAVKSPVKDPVEVRYGFHNYYEATLFNNAGVPASPFALKVPGYKKPALMWFDVSGNWDRFSNQDTITKYIDRIADLGFTHAVVCVRPISGYLAYDSELAPKFSGKNSDKPIDFDYLGKFIEEGHRRGLTVLVSMNAFCAGHNYLDKGLIYEGHPEWTSMVLDPDRGIIPITEQKNKYGGMVNPINPEYQEYILSVMNEILTKYPEADGLMLDRVRYDGITADFSDLSRREFEKYIGKKIKRFPEDILSLEKTGEGSNFRVVPGKYYKEWIEWRATNIKNFMARARQTVKDANPEAIFATYTGAWYPSYYEVGVNFASDTYDPHADFPQWATETYKNTGYAELIDLYTTGNYYTNITVAEERDDPEEVWNETDSEGHTGSWYCVQGSCQHLRDIMGPNEVIGGLLVDQYYDDPSKLTRAIEMNLRGSDGLMVFDIVHIINRNLWKEVEEGMKRGGNL